MESTSTQPTAFQPGNSAAVGHGAPVGNVNAMKHGRRSNRRLTIGALPKGCSWINTLTSNLRRELEALTVDAHGKVTPTHAMFIQSAARHEQAALMAQRWLRIHSTSMNHGERLAYLQAIASESDKRDKCVERLKLDKDAVSVLDQLYGPKVTELPAEGGNDATL